MPRTTKQTHRCHSITKASPSSQSPGSSSQCESGPIPLIPIGSETSICLQFSALRSALMIGQQFEKLHNDSYDVLRVLSSSTDSPVLPLSPDLAASCEGYLLEMKRFLVDNATHSLTSLAQGLTSCDNIQGAFLANLVSNSFNADDDAIQSSSHDARLALLNDEPGVISAVQAQIDNWTIELIGLSKSLCEFLSCDSPVVVVTTNGAHCPVPLEVNKQPYLSVHPTSQPIVIESHEALKRQCWRIEELIHLRHCLSELLSVSEQGQQAQHWKELVDAHEQLGWIFLPSSSSSSLAYSNVGESQ
jgi:hypothetical protein